MGPLYFFQSSRNTFSLKNLSPPPPEVFLEWYFLTIYFFFFSCIFLSPLFFSFPLFFYLPIFAFHPAGSFGRPFPLQLSPPLPLSGSFFSLFYMSFVSRLPIEPNLFLLPPHPPPLPKCLSDFLIFSVFELCVPTAQCAPAPPFPPSSCFPLVLSESPLNFFFPHPITLFFFQQSSYTPSRFWS